jgi:peptide/nickel transport system substrate-binding protein
VTSRRWLLLFVVVCSVLGLNNLTLAQDAQAFRIGLPAPVELNPFLGSNDPEILFNRAIYDYLLDVSPTGEIVPQLATDYAVSDDGLTYTLTLREGVTFHDGSVFTSKDAAYSFNALKEAASPALNLLGSDFTVEAPDDQTLVFTLTAPNADFIYGLASRWSFIVKDGATDINVLAEGDNPYSNFNGTGAYMLTEYKPGESATFTANPNYWWEGYPKTATISHIYINDTQAQIDAIRGGTVDFIFKVPFDQVDALTAEGLNVITKATNQHPIIRLRSDAGHLGEDVRVRQAFKLATDRELLNLNLFDGLAVVGNNDPIGPLYGDFYDDSIAKPEYDPEAACALLAEAGYPDGLGADEPLEFYIDDSFNYVQMAEFLQEQWKEGCINVTILPRNPGDYYAGENDVAEWLNVDLAVTGWGSRPIPQQYLVEAYVTGGTYNESHWSDPELDTLVEEAGVTTDQAERAGIYSQIAGIFAERGPIIVPFFAPIVGVTAANVEGLDLNPFPGSTDVRGVAITGE